MPQTQSCLRCGETFEVGSEERCPSCGLRHDRAFPPSGAKAVHLSDSELKASGQFEIFGDYELMEEIGRGAMGVVFKARQLKLNRIVAVKMILAGALANNDLIKRFKIEAESAASLKHPNIITIHEIGEHDGQHFFSMNWVAGKNLESLARYVPLPMEKAASYVQIIAEAIQHAHEKGVVHRDLKPSNVLIDEHDNPVITDFGLAKWTTRDSQLTLSGEMVGTPQYMSPEQVAGKKDEVGPVSDVYSLGAILYHLLTARPPFNAETLPEIYQQVAEKDPVSPRVLNEKISRDLETICLKCLEKSAFRRYASAGELAADLGRFLSGEPIQARPATTFYKAAKWVRRKPALASLIAVMTLSLVTILCLILISNMRLKAQRDIAEANRKEAVRQMEIAEEHRRIAEQNRQEVQRKIALSYYDQATRMAEMRDAPRALLRLVESLAQAPPEDAGLNRVLRQNILSWCSKLQMKEGRPDGTPIRDVYPAYSAFFLSPGSAIAVLQGKAVRVFRLDTQRWLHDLSHDSVVSAAKLSRDGRFLLSGCEDGKTYLWDPETGRKKHGPFGGASKSTAAEKSAVIALDMSQDGKFLAASAEDGLIHLFHISDGTPMGNSISFTPPASALVFHPNSLRIFAGSTETRDWIAEGPNTMVQGQLNFPQGRCLELTSDGRHLITAGSRGPARVWEIESASVLLTIPQHQPITALALSSDDKLLAVGVSNGAVHVWDLEVGKQICAPFHLPPHGGQIVALSFHPGGQKILVTNEDGEVVLCDLPQPVNGTLELVKTWVEYMTRMESQKGIEKNLTTEEVEERKQKLDQIGWPVSK